MKTLLKRKDTIPQIAVELKEIAPSIARGVLAGSITASALPVVLTIGKVVLPTFLAFVSCKLHEFSPGFATVATLPHFIIILMAIAISLSFIYYKSLAEFSHRCRNWAIYEAALIWGVASFLFWTCSLRWALASLLLAIMGTIAVAWNRSTILHGTQLRLDSDGAIHTAAQDKLKRAQFVASVANRLLEEAAPVIGLVGAYGDGKTSILNLLGETLAKRGVVVVNFKSSLPGDELTLISTLFNSVSKQLNRRFFIQGLDNSLKKFARIFSGLIPSAPTGLKDLFAQPSQEQELKELADRLPTYQFFAL